MTLHDVLVLVHLLLFVYWLGADLGVFYASRFVLRSDLTMQARSVVLRIMDWLDMSPRICLVLFLPSGVSLMANHPLGRDVFAGWPVALVWILSLVWLGLVIADHKLRGQALGTLVRRVDLLVRIVVVVALLAVAAYAFVAPKPFGADSNPRWLAAKVGLYAIAIACGVAIRITLRPFGPAFARLRAGGGSEDEAVLTRSMRHSIPFVLAIWVCVALAAALGVAKPGSAWVAG